MAAASGARGTVYTGGVSIRLPLLLLAVCVASAALAQDANVTTDPKAEVLATENLRYKAMIEVDAAALDRLLADELLFTHSSGVVEPKHVFIASLESGDLDYRSVRTKDIQVHVYGDTAVVTGLSTLELAVRGAPRKAKLRFTSVYSRSEVGDFRLVAYQSTQASES